MHLHHLALGARDVELVAGFYRNALNLAEIDRHTYDDGLLRSVWLKLGDAILMVEHTTDPERLVSGVGHGPFLLAFAIEPGEQAQLEERLLTFGCAIEDRTAYTCYFRDPEGNRVALSHYRG